MNPAIGPILRLAGPLLQVACLILLLAPGVRGRSVAGLPVPQLLYVGFGLGFVLVIAGLVLSRRGSRRPPRGGLDD